MGVPMTLDELDNELTNWRAHLATANANVAVLTRKTTYKMLSGTGGFPKPQLSGITLQKVPPALSLFVDEWDDVFLQLTNKITDVEQARTALPKKYTPDQFASVVDMLFKASITISVPPGSFTRGLLTPLKPTQVLTPQDALDLMVKAFEQAQEVVGDVEKAQSIALSRAKSTVAEIDSLSQLAVDLGLGNLPEVLALKSQVTSFDNQITSDPLGVKDDFDKNIEPILKSTRARLDKLATDLSNLQNDLVAADQLMTNLDTSHKEAKRLYAEREAKILMDGADRLPRPLEDSVITALREWLDRLLNLVSQKKNWTAAVVGLSNWQAQLKVRQDYCDSVSKAHGDLVAKRTELKGYLQALRAKACNTGLAEEPRCSSLYVQARDIINNIPTPLAQAEKMVNDYQQAIR